MRTVPSMNPPFCLTLPMMEAYTFSFPRLPPKSTSCYARTSALPMITSRRLARLMATLILLKSEMKAEDLVLTRERMITSLSSPWKSSTDLTLNPSSPSDWNYLRDSLNSDLSSGSMRSSLAMARFWSL